MRIRLAGLAVSAWLAVAVLGAQGASALSPGTFYPTGGMTVPREGGAAAPLPDGRVLVAGGYYFDGSAHLLSSAEIYDPATGAFSPTGAMTVPRSGAAAAPLPGGRVLVAGGDAPPGASAEIYDPASGAFSASGSMTVPRWEAAAAPLPDGRVLVAGGTNGSQLASAEIYDPATGAFSPTGSMTVPRQGAVAAPLPDGRVLVAGDWGGYVVPGTQNAEVFDPATESFSSTGIGSLGTFRYGAVAAPLPDGRVLVAGGYPDLETRSNPESSAEVFNPATESFSSAGIGEMLTRRAFAAAAPLPGGEVLVAGGYDSGFSAGVGVLASAEIFGTTNRFRYSVKGRKLIVKVQASGRVAVRDAAARRSASAAKGKRKLRLRPSSASGDPPKIVVGLVLTKLAKAELVHTGAVRVNARITFTPQGGPAKTRAVNLELKAKRRR